MKHNREPCVNKVWFKNTLVRYQKKHNKEPMMKRKGKDVR